MKVSEPDQTFERLRGRLFGLAYRMLGTAHDAEDVLQNAPEPVRRELAWLNGEPAVITDLGDRVFSTCSVATDGQRITAFYAVVNPDKLGRVGEEADTAAPPGWPPAASEALAAPRG